MKRFPKWAGYLLLPIIILVLIGLLSWESVSYYVLKNSLKFIAAKEHIALDVNRIHGKLFSETTIKDISLRPQDGQPQAYQFKADTITCTYNFWDLQEGLEQFLQGLNCTAESPEFTQDFSVSMPEEEMKSEFKTFILPAVLPQLDVRNGTIILSNAGWNTEIHGINSSLRSTVTHRLTVARDPSKPIS